MDVHIQEILYVVKCRLGFNLEIGAPASVVGLFEDPQICSLLQRETSLPISSTSLQFADAT